MSKLEIARSIVTFLAGFGLGVLNFRWYEKSMVAILARGELTSVRKQVTRAGIFRHVFIFLAGITLVWAAECPPIHLCGGLLTSVFVYRRQLWKRTGQSEGESLK